ncbi:MAG TPA: twin-arginine translocation signal domain-containing protein [Blastocatellia bacterium]|nr:twin-arginine translocation signal domain-containing protein [Blastocatellia bacterium]
MTVSRREFLKRGALVGAAAALPLSLTNLAAAQSGKGTTGGTTGGGAANPYDAVAKLNKASFTPCIGTTFKMYAGLKTVDVKLTGIKDVASPTGKPVPGGECFDLAFQGAPYQLLRQNTFIMDHPKLGKFALLVVQVGLDSKASYFEAVFNRRLQ